MKYLKVITKNTHKKIKRVKLYIKNGVRTCCVFRNRKEQAIILIGSPQHGNLGDYAISIAERNFFKDYFPDKSIIEIGGQQYRSYSNQITKRVREKDLIIITGGGFLGSLWINEEEMVRSIINKLPNNPIIIFPQSIFFEENAFGNKEKEVSKICYESHDKLCICLREEKSYNFMLNEFKGVHEYLLMPDMVTFLNISSSTYPRDGVLLCMRRDKERVMSDKDLKEIEEFLGKEGLKYTYTSTVLEYNVGFKKRQYEVMNKITEFKKSRLVITDRLHGMIFAAITGTPCIALDNISGKVKGVYKWLEHIKYIKFVEDFSHIERNVIKMLSQGSYEYDNENIKKYFQLLAEKVKCYLGE